MKNNIKKSIESGLAFIGSVQLDNGGFVSYSSPSIDHSSEGKSYETTFFPSLILSSLAQLDSPEAVAINSKIATFLRTQASKNWSYNYWSRASKQYISQPYPDDLDDTFCALASLLSYDANFFKGADMAKIMQILFAAESQEGGPYHTWLVDSKDDSVWKDIDIAVNSNIGYFLSLQEVELPHIVEMIEQAIDNEAIYSQYYPHVYAIIYFISRWYKGAKKDNLTQYLIREMHASDSWKNPLCVSLILICLIRLQYPRKGELNDLVKYLLQAQVEDGSWPSFAFCIDPSVKGKKYYAGARSLTSALCLEALQLYTVSQAQPYSYQQSTLFKKHRIHEQVMSMLYDSRQSDLEKNTSRIVDELFRHRNSSEIVGLPFIISSAFEVDINQDILNQFSAINVMGWVAYTIYDDFMDGEGEVWRLATANFCLRRLVSHLEKILPQSIKFHNEVRHIFDRLDAANAWEINQTRFRLERDTLYLTHLPDYEDYSVLADRSLGHMISAIGVLYASGLKNDTVPMAYLRTFMKHYLIARQLNDDAHDWEEDIKKGSVNSVARILLEKHFYKNEKTEVKELSLKRALPQLRSIMWQEAIEVISGLIHYHIHCARIALQYSTHIVNKEIFEQLLLPLERAAESALFEKKRAQDLINAL